MRKNVGKPCNRESAINTANVDFSVDLVHHEAPVVEAKSVQPRHQLWAVDHVQRILLKINYRQFQNKNKKEDLTEEVIFDRFITSPPRMDRALTAAYVGARCEICPGPPPNPPRLF